jgi:hypothetical protein
LPAETEEYLKAPKAGRRSLKRYEITNLLFFLGLIAVLGVLVSFVFHYYGTRNEVASEESETGVISDALGENSDIGMFYLGTKLSETTHEYRSRLEIPVTDDGLIRELFSLPGVEEVSINQRVLMIRKSHASRWDSIQQGVRRIVKEHLHLHY